MEALAEAFLMGKANVYGATSFYDFLREENRGKRVYICNGSACMTAGTQPDLRNKLRQRFADPEIGEMCCLGRCHENAAFYLDGHNYSGSDIDTMDWETADRKPSAETYRVGTKGTPVLTAPAPGVDTYESLWRSILARKPDELLHELRVSGLRGRGGAGFPIAIKLDGCRNETDPVKFIVCNADEGDPGAYSDRYLLERQPHRVLLGMMVAGYITGATTGVVYIRGEYPEAIRITEEAVREFEAKGLTGESIRGTEFRFRFKIIAAQGAYICGEETALLSSIEGQRPEVRVRPPYPVQQGLFNKPTVVNNVETLACIPFIVEQGGAAFASIGSGRSTGTKLMSLDGFFRNPGIYEVDMGVPLQTVIDELGGGFREPVKALHIGGPLGGLVPVEKIAALTVDFESFQQNGFLLGHASIVCLPVGFPIIRYLTHLFRFTAHESCGKCFPCRIGSTRGYELLERAQETEYRIDRQLFEDLVETLETGSLCALGGGLPLPIRNALHYFENELAPYFKKQ
jgi:NADH-quinone oxidoreductase subunit F